MHLKFVNVVDAITLMIMSIIIPEYESYKQKPTIYALHGNGIPNEKIKISYRRPMTFKNLKSMLFEVIILFFVFINLSNINFKLFFSQLMIYL